MTPIIEVHNATVYRGRTRVFDKVSLSIQPNENTAILGPNGAGKSTFMRLITREIYPVKEEGSWVKLYGKDRWNIAELREQMGIVSQDLQADYRPIVRCIDVVLSGFYSSIGIWPHQEFTEQHHEKAHAMLDELGVSHLAEKKIATVSTGEQRRVLLARALINNPDTLILDEPTSGLDLKACYQYLNTIQSLIEEGKTIILVTHHIHEIPPEVTRVVLINEGKVLADGPKDEILTDEWLSALYETPLKVIKGAAYFQVLPE
ncbi:MAG: ATP-binding cassette domain-containing protein [Rhodothermaceae bacterium]|nr:ATP-binding cassette domain-containing protein [Rhodothermaceae bacterium]